MRMPAVVSRFVGNIRQNIRDKPVRQHCDRHSKTVVEIKFVYGAAARRRGKTARERMPARTVRVRKFPETFEPERGEKKYEKKIKTVRQKKSSASVRCVLSEAVV